MRFTLKAVDSRKGVVVLQIDAQDEAGARDAARQRGYAVLNVTRKSALPLALRARKRFPTVVFSIELLALLDAGLNIVEALQALCQKESQAEHRRELQGILDALHRGESLSQAFMGYPEAFPPLYVATIRSSERTGDLKEALTRYVSYQEELDKVRKKVVAALIYPAILVVVGVLVLGFLLLYVVPRFARVYEDISSDLPLFSSILLSVGRWIDANGFAVLLVSGTVCAAAGYALSHQKVRAALVERLLATSMLARRVRTYQLARLYRTVGMLLRAGIPAVKSFEMVRGLLPAHQRPQLQRATELIQQGQAISTALTEAGLATPVATRMMVVGEKSGRMGDLMDRIARFCDDETARFVDAFTRIFEPVLMAGIGVAVGLIVVLMYMPIFELAGSVR
jgi:general secretion pathway protein F